MSSNTTFSSQGNFKRPEIVKLQPQRNIVNIIILGATILLLSIPFISSISHTFADQLKYNSPTFLSLYPIVLSAIFIFSLINVLKDFYSGFSKWYEMIFASVCNILYITSMIAFIIITIQTSHNTNWVKNSLWDFSEVHTRTEKNSRLDLCIQAYFGIPEWISLSFFTYLTALYILFCFKLPEIIKILPYISKKPPDTQKFTMLLLKGPLLLGLVSFFVYQLGYKPWYQSIHSKKAEVTCPTKNE